MKFTLIGVIIASAFMSLLHSTKGIEYTLEWIPNYSPPLIFGLIGLTLGSLIAGKIAGKMIFKGGLPVLWGILSAILVVWTAVLTASIFMIIDEAFVRTSNIGDLIEDYLFKPLYWINLIGSFPIVILGLLYGYKLKNKFNNPTDTQ